MIPEQLRELEELEAKATPGPWMRHENPRYYVQWEGPDADKEMHDANAHLCASLRNHAKELIEAAKREYISGNYLWWSCGEGHEHTRMNNETKYRPKKECPACIATAEIQHLKSLLRKHQIREFGGQYYCVECGEYENKCAPNCELAAAIGGGSDG